MAQNLLIIGGSGFLSGTLARVGLEAGQRVFVVTRGRREIPAGVDAITADRKDDVEFSRAIAAAQIDWDLVVDCIAYEGDDAEQDLRVFKDCAGRLVMISTDFVYDPARRRFPQPEETAYYLPDGYGGKKRLAELALIHAEDSPLPWTVLRPCHIYGPGSQLGCLPEHGRDPQLISRLQDGDPLRLVGGGHFLQQPIFARDLAETILSCAGVPQTAGKIINVAGPDVVESITYYQIIADLLGVKLNLKESSVGDYLADHPEAAPFLCHRFYDLDKLRTSGAHVPATPLADGLREHVLSMITSLPD